MQTGEIHIKKGFWWGAGSPKIYNWSKDGYHQFGVGIDKRMLFGFNQLRIQIEGKEYLLNTDEAMKFISEYNSTKKIRGIELGVISKTLLMPIYE